ncbi:MAG: LacI family DNA-binding transcriptional regulator [Planctomycetota bacterium]
MVTVYDIAKAADVSYSTATRVLNGKADYVRPTFIKRAERIRKIALKMGYRPNAAARATSSGRFNAIGVVVRRRDKIGFGPHPSYIRGINRVLDDAGNNLVMAPVDPQAVTDEQAPRILQESMVDGLIIGDDDLLGEQAHATLEGLHIPSIWINTKRDQNAVYPDEFGGSQVLTKHLLELGHRRIAFCGSPSSDHYSSTDRAAGYTAAMRDAGLTPHPLVWANKPRERLARIEAAMATDDRPTAWLAIDAAYEPVLIAAAKQGLAVPEDMSLLAMGHGQAMHSCHVDTYEIPCYWVGYHAAEMLFKRINDPDSADLPALPVAYDKYIPGDTLAQHVSG